MKKLTLAMTISLVLTACGSGGSGSGQNSSATLGELKGAVVAYDMYLDKNGKLKPKLDKDPNANGGQYAEEIMKTVYFSGKDLNHIMINGTNIQLLPDGYNKQENYEERVSEYKKEYTGDPINPTKVVEMGKVLSNVISGLQYKYVRFGVHNDYIPDPNDLSNDDINYAQYGIFVQGYVTTDMPKAGKVTYLGDAYGGSDTPLTKGKVKIDVDFGKKMLKGKISDWQNYAFLKDEKISHDMLFNAEIKGNKFKGKNIEGGFFGYNAAEIAGIYDDRKIDEGAVFGAKKQ
ncbi:transferrin-binding protein-like solute binding protein [Pasteurella atlantica]|uniref:transferrin-binding protein-like solute binding protein n=1 Tax=Pasteurellaceae TaxID=712 RepID=UPI002760C775|nr:transferrin-binding protein-like solute binding protein [Pasteurella atlantica]MDP8098721.1 transferrin-binding protein-like solute binding protein [Pasteurella atlantica]MDP8101741.1 transferrin-binding protein-like solute binding protein [Pasteurella atlantica]MDP8106833.1 transferrin-binding protein-like solute binding protein [Pasteurella atlantica]MDP8116523.1 transferrin-binding protein-like solute binding protein [Pasteurella atlantica]